MNINASQLDETLKNESFSRSSVIITSTVEAGKTVSFSHYGERFYFRQCTSELQVKTESTAFKPYRKGNGEKFPQELRFKRLEIRNDNNYTVTFQLWVGFGEYIDTTSEVVENFTAIIGLPSTTLGPLAEIVSDGIPSGFQIQRKQIIVTNLDTANPIYIKDQNNNFCCAVMPGFSIALNVSGYIKLVNTTASAIPIAASEIWYVFQP